MIHPHIVAKKGIAVKTAMPFARPRAPGIREYWIVDPSDKTVQVFVLEDGRYTAKDFGAAGDMVRVNVLEGCTIDLSPVFSE